MEKLPCFLKFIYLNNFINYKLNDYVESDFNDNYIILKKVNDNLIKNEVKYYRFDNLFDLFICYNY
jgi:hypothetical protein